jgi:hypothetical protein
MRLRASTSQIVMPEICRRKPWRDPAAETTLPGQPPTNPLGVKGLRKIGIQIARIPGGFANGKAVEYYEYFDTAQVHAAMA